MQVHIIILSEYFSMNRCFCGNKKFETGSTDHEKKTKLTLFFLLKHCWHLMMYAITIKYISM